MIHSLFDTLLTITFVDKRYSSKEEETVSTNLSERLSWYHIRSKTFTCKSMRKLQPQGVKIMATIINSLRGKQT